MKIIFVGTPDFALPALHALLHSSHEICAVYTKPDRPAGRGQKLTASPVKQLALTYNLPLYQPQTLKDSSVQKQLQSFNADVLIDVAYGLILPEAVLNLPKFGCINLHPSLLPRWRGAAPIQRAIMAGDTVTGVTIMKIDTGLDTGDIYKQVTLPIDNNDTSETLMEKTSEIGARLLLEVLDEIIAGLAKTITQNHSENTYANKISKDEGKINWQKNATEIERMIRAFNPWPVAYTTIDNQYIRIWQATIKNSAEPKPNLQGASHAALPGTILHIDKNSIEVATTGGVLCLQKIQFPGGKPLEIKDLLNAHSKIFISTQDSPARFI